MSDSQIARPGLLIALVPVMVLIGCLFFSSYLFGDGSSSGPNQIGLILSAMVAIAFGLKMGYTWKELEAAMVHGISLSMGAIFILLVVGSLIGAWILCGTVPTMIYYGLQLMNPNYFYVASCAICSVVAISTGSSWTTAGTVGIALVGISKVMGLDPGIAAGAIISGAYFGDKLPPLSDTTNLAPAMAGTDLFTHIRHMLWTTIPSMTLTLIIFTFIGMGAAEGGNAENIDQILQAIDQNFNVGWYLLIPPVLVIFMVVKKVPAFPALLIGSLVGCVFAGIFQQETLSRFVGNPELDSFRTTIKGCWTALFGGFSGDMGNESLTKLMERGGMANMLNTIWLIICAMMFGASMEKTKMLEVIAGHILGLAKNTGSLICATLCTSIGMNIVASDQYIAIVLPGRMFRAEFLNRRLHPKNLSRCLEDAGTLTSPLVPWNTCGAYMSSTLGVPVATYFMFCFFNMLNPIISAIYGFTGFSIEKISDEQAAEYLEA